jgi:hypothetical protein
VRKDGVFAGVEECVGTGDAWWTVVLERTGRLSSTFKLGSSALWGRIRQCH